MSRARFCWTCGATKDVSSFNPKEDERDGLQAECKACQEGRETARRLDGKTGERTERIDGEGRRRPLRLRNNALTSITLDQMLRTRPKSGPTYVH